LPEPTPQLCTQADGCHDDPNKPLFETLKFKGSNVNDVMIDGFEVKPAKSEIVGRVKYNEKQKRYAGNIRLNLYGYYSDLNSRVRLQYSGVIDKVETKETVLSVDTLDSEFTAKYHVFQIHSVAKKLVIHKQGEKYVYENAELEMIYDPHTGSISVTSITGTLVERSPRQVKLTQDAVDFGKALQQTYALGFKEM